MGYCKPLDEMVAIKVMDLERQDPGKLVRSRLPLARAIRTAVSPFACAQEEIRKEAMTMNILSHPNLVQSLASFVSGAVRNLRLHRVAAVTSVLTEAPSSAPPAEPVGGDALLGRRLRSEHYEVP